MPLLVFEHFHTARASLRRTRTRTVLTMLGVAIGIASITAIMALTQGVIDIIGHQTASVGDRLAVVRPLPRATNLISLTNPTPADSYSSSPLTEADVATIQKTPGVESVAPIMTISGNVRSSSSDPAISNIVATTPAFAESTNLKLDVGQFLDTVTIENTAILGQQLSIDLFGTSQSIGKTFLIKGQTFTVIGIAQRQDSPINFNNIDLDRSAIISFNSGKLLSGGVAQIQQVNIMAKPGVSLHDLKKTLQLAINHNHLGEKDTAVLIGKEISQPTNKLFILINSVMALVAGISLIVGGVGIMNIMLVSVTERTREIGLRKSVGASSAAIIFQFMIEALIISGIGGLFGYIGGYVTAFVVSLSLPYDPSISWQIAAWAFGLAIGVGILFGLYPAIRAARKNPIESLRRPY